MRKLDDIYIALGLLWVAFGMAFGIWMGVTEQLNFANSHAHTNLVGFVASVLFGLIHRSYPSLRLSPLAVPQLIAYQVGAVLLVAGKMIIDNGGDNTVVKIGSVVVLLGTLAMAYLFMTRRNRETTTDMGSGLRGMRSAA